MLKGENAVEMLKTPPDLDQFTAEYFFSLETFELRRTDHNRRLQHILSIKKKITCQMILHVQY